MQLRDLGGHFVGRGAPYEAVVVDADREAADANSTLAVIERDYAPRSTDAHAIGQRSDALNEVAPVPKCLKADEIVAEQRTQDFESPW